MAKKSSKSKKSSVSLDLIFKAGIVLFAVAALAMLFLSGVVFTGELTGVENVYTGFQTIFGYTQVSEGLLGSTVSTEVLGFSFLNLLPLVLVVAGVVCSLLKGKMLNFVGAGLLVLGAVMFFLMPTFTVVAGVDNLITVALNNSTRALGIGAILGGIFAAVAGALSLVKILKK